MDRVNPLSTKAAGNSTPPAPNPHKVGESRRAFLQRSALAGAAGLLPLTGLMPGAQTAYAAGHHVLSSPLNSGDIAILRFLAAAEIIESDLWLQYAELGGTQDNELPGLTGGNPVYTNALKQLDGDMDQYIHDNTEDEFSHASFLNNYLKARGAQPVNLDKYRTLPSSKATGAQQIGRLTNLMHLSVDTSWYTRYRSRDHNPDLDPGFVFPQAVPSLASGHFPAIPRNNSDLTPNDHIQAIADTAAFHFAFIEQGGTSLYATMALLASDLEVLRIIVSIGGTEVAHFQTWHDKAGNAVSAPLAPLTDPVNPTLVFPNLNNPPGNEDFQTNLIMPEPCPFLSRDLHVSVIRPTSLQKGGAVAAANSLIADGLFYGQSNEFLTLLLDLANAADSATRNV